MTGVTILGFGYHVPERVVTNDDLAKIVDTNDEWITSRTGIKQRHLVQEGEVCSDLSAEAARKALTAANMQAEEITHVIVGTCTGDAPIPATATQVCDKLGIKGQTAFDINAACSGFVYGLDIARGFIAVHPDAKVLLIGAEVLSSRLNWEDRTTCVLFGDGAGAAIIGASGQKEAELVDVQLSSDGSLGDLLRCKGGGCSHPPVLGDTIDDEYFIKMQGREVFKHAVRSMVGIAKDLLEKNNMTVDDIDMVLTHQANARIIDAVGKKLGVSAEKAFVNVHKFGNTSAASIPIALADAREEGTIKDGYTVLVATFGGGFTWGSALLKF
ncbi:MAG: beta-ketoacyl-ACP synthase III [Desulfovibrio sp.]